jgi:uncharacterized membrane protein (UPF0127 family)
VLITNVATGAVLATDARVATDPWTRLIGLMERRRLEAGAALVSPGTRQVHTHFMCVPIDVVFCAADGTGVHPIHALRPRKPGGRRARAAGLHPGGDGDRARAPAAVRSGRADRLTAMVGTAIVRWRAARVRRGS